MRYGVPQKKRGGMNWLLLVLIVLSVPSLFAQEKQPALGQKALLPNISLIGSFAGAWFRNEPVGDQGENPSRTGMNLQTAELAIQSVIDPYLRGDFFLLFKEDAVEVEDATITTLSLPANLQARAGKFPARFGRQNTQHVEQLDFVDQSLTNRYFFGPEGFSELGGELSGLIPLPWFSELSFEFLQGENAGNFDGGRRGDFAWLGHWKNGFDISGNVAGQFGLSGAAGFNNTATGNLTQIYGSDFYLRWRPSVYEGLKWQTEYILRRREGAGDIENEGGGYSQLIWQFARRWETGFRAERIGWPSETVRQWSLSPQLTFLTTEFFRVRGQYNLVHTASVAREQHEAFLQIQFNMGSHGAHVF